MCVREKERERERERESERERERARARRGWDASGAVRCRANSAQLR